MNNEKYRISMPQLLHRTYLYLKKKKKNPFMTICCALCSAAIPHPPSTSTLIFLWGTMALPF